MQSILRDVIMDNHPPDIARDRVVNNLRNHGVSVVETGHTYILSKEGVVERRHFAERVNRHLIGRLSAKFNIENGLVLSATRLLSASRATTSARISTVIE